MDADNIGKYLSVLWMQII